MTEQQIDLLLEKQRAYFASGATLNVEKRIDALRRLRSVIKKYQTEIAESKTIVSPFNAFKNPSKI